MILVTLILLATGPAPGCGSPRTAGFPGIDQARSFQRALQHCLRIRDIAYTPVVEPPGSVLPLVLAPVPTEWWAHRGGYGLLADQGGEVVLDPTWTDPNIARRRAIGSARWNAAIYGDGQGEGRFAPGSCFDRSLRAAGFWDERRAGSLREPTEAERATTLADPTVQAAGTRLRSCLERRGVEASVARDPEAVLRRRFTDAGLISEDGATTPTASATDLERARAIEEHAAVAEVRCRRSVSFDRTYDAALRRSMGVAP